MVLGCDAYLFSVLSAKWFAVKRVVIKKVLGDLLSPEIMINTNHKENQKITPFVFASAGENF